MIETEEVDGKHVASAVYRLADKISDTNVSFWFRDFRKQPSDLHFRVGDEDNAVVLYGKANGKSDGYYYTYEIINGVKIFMDNRCLLSSNLVKNFDGIDMNYVHASKADFMVIDEFEMVKSNPMASISLPDEAVTLGYYDTYTIGYGNIAYTAVNTSYPTTDRLVYFVTDNDILKVTPGGSVEGGSKYKYAIFFKRGRGRHLYFRRGVFCSMV